MKNEQLKRLIKEEIKNILKENNPLDRQFPPNKGEKINYGPSNPKQEKISGGDFNIEVTEFLRNLKMNKAGMDSKELKNLLDLFDLLVQKSKESNLTQPMEDRIKKILMLKTQPEPGV